MPIEPIQRFANHQESGDGVTAVPQRVTFETVGNPQQPKQGRKLLFVSVTEIVRPV